MSLLPNNNSNLHPKINVNSSLDSIYNNSINSLIIYNVSTSASLVSSVNPNLVHNQSEKSALISKYIGISNSIISNEFYYVNKLSNPTRCNFVYEHSKSRNPTMKP